jgi:hypothetical protein
LWSADLDGVPLEVPAYRSQSSEYPRGIALSADGEHVVVAADTWTVGHPDLENFLTIDLDGDTGEERWRSVYNGPCSRADFPNAVTIDDAGGRVLVAGKSYCPTTGFDAAVIAIELGSGERSFVGRAAGGPSVGFEIAYDVVVASDGGSAYTAGASCSLSDGYYACPNTDWAISRFAISS